MKLTEKRRKVLKALSRYANVDREPDHHQIAVDCGQKYATADWAHGALRALLEAGYVEVAGKRYMGGRTWRITPLGRTMLSSV